jgi:hypothetical protein
MSVGLAVFLSSLLLSIVLLYGITKDRWAWRLFLKRTALVCLTLIFGLAASIAGIYVWNQLPTAVARQTEYARLRLGMNQDEVMYIKGYPPSVLGEEVGDPAWKGFFGVIETKNLEKGKRVTDYRDWSYNEYESNINVAFNDEKTAVVAIQCFSKDKLSRCPAIAGLSDGNTEKQAIRRLGPPSDSQFQGVTKWIAYHEQGIKLTLEKEQVYMLEISVPRYVRR